MINLLIIVLRAAAALVNALIAILELIRQLINECGNVTKGGEGPFLAL